MDVYKDSFNPKRELDIKQDNTIENQDIHFDIENVVKKSFENLDIRIRFSIKDIHESLSMIITTDSYYYDYILDEMKHYDFCGQLFYDYMSISDRELAVKCLQAMNIYLENSEQNTSLDILFGLFEKVLSIKYINECDELEYIIESLSLLLKEETILYYENNLYFHIFSLISTTKDESIIDNALQFAYNYVNITKNNNDIPNKNIMDFIETFTLWIINSPPEVKKKEKVALLSFITTNIKDSKDIIEKTIPYIYSMGNEVYSDLFLILKEIGPSSPFYSKCSSAAFNVVISSCKDDSYIPAICLIDKCLCQSKELFIKNWVNNRGDIKILASSLAKEILFGDIKHILFSGRLLFLLVINFPSDFLDIDPWMNEEHNLNSYNLCNAFKKCIELEDDITQLAAYSIMRLYETIKEENEDDLESFCSVMQTNGIIDELQCCIESDEDDIVSATIKKVTQHK